MYSNYAELISLLLVAIYIYVRIKDKIALYVLGDIIYMVVCFYLYHVMYPNIPLHSPTCEYMGLLFFLGLGFIVTMSLTAIELEKRKKRSLDDNANKASSAFKLSKVDIIFWGIIVLLNLVAYLL